MTTTIETPGSTIEPSLSGPTADVPKPSASGNKTRRSGLALAVICTAQVMVVLDATIMYVALPAIQHGLRFSSANLVWVSTAYTLTFGGLLLLGGRSGDLFGRRRMFRLGVAVFALASLLGGFAQSDLWLIVTRAAQGVGGAIASPTALSLIATNFSEGPARNRAMGIYAAMSGAGSTIGLLAGGLLVEYVSWRWVLLVNVPIGIAVLFLTPRVLEESAVHRGRLDVPGAVTVTAGMALLVYGFTSAASHGWASLSTLNYLGAAAILLAAFVGLEARSTHPLMPLRVFADRNRAGAYTVMFCFGAAMFAFFYFMTQYLQDVLGYSALVAGLCFVPMSLAIMVLSQIVAGRLAHTGIRAPLLVGPASVAVALLWAAQANPASGYLDVIGPLLLLALGIGLSFVPLTVTAVAGIDSEDAGLAAAVLNTGQMVGGAVGLSLLSTVAVSAFHARTAQLVVVHHALTPSLLRTATVYGYHRSYLVGAAIAIVALAASAAFVRSPLTAAAMTTKVNPRPITARTAEASLQPAVLSADAATSLTEVDGSPSNTSNLAAA